MLTGWGQAAAALGASSTLLLTLSTSTVDAFVVCPHVSTSRVGLVPTGHVAVSPPRSLGQHCRRGASSASRARARGKRHGSASKLSMAFDLGQMMEQVMGSFNGRGGGAGGGNGRGEDKGGVVYDVGIVGYGPAGGVMVRNKRVS